MTHYVMFKPRLKYGNIREEYRGGRFASKKEARKAQELDLLVRAKEIKGWEKQKKLSLDVNGKHIATYYLDFVIYENDGGITYCEIKSPITCTEVWKMKWKLAQAIYTDPNIKWVVEM